MLKITKATDPIVVNHITVCVYAQPGLGRTSLGFTSGGLLLDFDKGAYRSAFRRDSVWCESWADVEKLEPADLEGYPAIVVDTAGRALDALAQDIIRKDAKLGRGGDLTLQGWGVLKGRFAGWLKYLHSMGKDVVLLAHLDEQRKGDEVLERLDIQGSSRQEIYKLADAMARLYLDNGQRKLSFNPSDTAFGKNPAMIPVYEVPHFAKEPDFFADILAMIKAKLNEGSAAQAAEVARIEALVAEYLTLETLEEFNLTASLKSAASPKDKALLVQAAERKGFKLDMTQKPARFVENIPTDGGSQAQRTPEPAGSNGLKAGDPIPAEVKDVIRRKFFWWLNSAVTQKVDGFSAKTQGNTAAASKARAELLSRLIGEEVPDFSEASAEQLDKGRIRIEEIVNAAITGQPA